MTQAECSVKTLSDGTDICSIHKEPLQDITALAEVKNGLYEDAVNTYYCHPGQKHITTPFSWRKEPRGSRRA